MNNERKMTKTAMQRNQMIPTKCRWMMMALFIVHCSLFFSPVSAQTFTQRLQKQVKGEGVVTINQDADIDNLVNGPQPVITNEKKTKVSTQKSELASKPAKKNEAEKPAKKNDEEKTVKVPEERPIANNQEHQTDTSITIGSNHEPDSINIAPRRTYRTNGYRIQVYAGGNSRRDRQQAEQIGNQLRTLFPEEQVYVHFYSPRWICRIGNFKTYEEASQKRNELREMGFSTTTIVKGKITLQY